MQDPLQDGETARLAALADYHILDTPPEAAFDDIAQLAAQICGTPLALITLVDETRQWFKSCFGVDLRETPRALSFCRHALHQTELMIVPDLRRDPRFVNHPFVTGEPGVRFYAGAPLVVSGGHVLGTLCVLDIIPRQLSESQQRSLAALSRQVVNLLELRSTQNGLTENERQMRAVTDNVPALIARVDTQFRYVFANQNYQDFLGVPLQEVVGRPMWEVLGAEAFENIRPAVERALAGERSVFEGRMPFRTIGPRFTQASYVPERGPQGEVTGFLVSAIDITERRQAVEKLQQERDFTSAVVDTVGSLVAVLDRQGRVVRFNRASERLTGYASEDVAGRNILDLVLDPEEATAATTAFQSLTPDQFPNTHEGYIVAQDGSRRLVAWSNTALLDAEGAVEYVVATGTDITEREALLSETERLLAEATEQADHDPLTGLLNHRAFHKRLEEEADRAQRAGTPLAVAMVDLNDFRFFNDAYGHLAGDDVLRRVAVALQCGCRSYDTLARFGGDEFALLVPGLGPDEAAWLASRLHASMDGIGYQPPGYDTEIPLSLSVGTAVFPDESPSRLDVIVLADARLRRAKSGGDVHGESEPLRTAMSRSVEGFSMLDALVAAVDNKDRYTRRHSEDVLTYSLQIAEALGLGEPTCHTVAVAALLHDVGKIGVPDAILRKPGLLTEAEFEAIKQHPMMGAIMVSAVPGFEGTLDAVRHHHERWDGDGYPFGLSGEAIPLLARLMAVADAFSAMTTDRPYRKGMNHASARKILRDGAGSQWDPACVQAFLQTVGRAAPARRA